MHGRIFMLNGPTNPLLQLVYLLVGGVVLVAAVLMGAVILAVIFGLALILGIVVWIRIWWLRRRMARNPSRGPASRRSADVSGEFIEAEYTVLDERDPPDRRD